MPEQIKTTISNVLNSQYNKTVYSSVVGSAIDFFFGLLAEFHVDVSPGLQTKTLIFAMALTTLLVRNKEGSGENGVEGATPPIMPALLLVLGWGLVLAMNSCVWPERGPAQPEPTPPASTEKLRPADLEPFQFSTFHPVVADPENFKGTGGQELFCIPKDESLTLLEEMRRAQELIEKFQGFCGGARH